MKTSRAYLWLTILIGLAVMSTSAFGIFVSGTYSRETLDWATQARAQDIANAVGIVILLISAYFMSKGSVRGLLVWAGGLLFLIYAFMIYSFAAHYNFLFLLYVATLGLLVYSFLGGVTQLDFQKVKELWAVGNLARRATSIYLFVSAIIFYLLWLSEDIPALLSGTVPASVNQDGLLVNPIHVLDLGLYLPAMIITSVSLWRKRSLGYTFGVPLLIFASLTGLGILLIDYLTGFSAAVMGQATFVGILTAAAAVIAWIYLQKPRRRKIVQGFEVANIKGIR